MNSRSSKKQKYKAEKKRRFYNTLRKYTHNTFTLFMYIGLIAFVYLLFYCLLFEPLFISKTYGRSDTIEFLYLAFFGFLVGTSYFIVVKVDYTEEQTWQRNWRLLRDVNFNLDRYASLKRMGIDHLNKRKKRFAKRIPK